MAQLGVNIDHVATLRQARGVAYPDPLAAAHAAEAGGADSITVHLREDRRHIQDTDVVALRAGLHVGLNLEMAATPEMVAIALRIRPADVCLVPERRAEVTTEGGLGRRRPAPDVGRDRGPTERWRASGQPIHRSRTGADRDGGRPWRGCNRAAHRPLLPAARARTPSRLSSCSFAGPPSKPWLSV